MNIFRKKMTRIFKKFHLNMKVTTNITKFNITLSKKSCVCLCVYLCGYACAYFGE